MCAVVSFPFEFSRYSCMEPRGSRVWQVRASRVDSCHSRSEMREQPRHRRRPLTTVTGEGAGTVGGTANTQTRTLEASAHTCMGGFIAMATCD